MMSERSIQTVVKGDFAPKAVSDKAVVIGVGWRRRPVECMMAFGEQRVKNVPG